MKKIFNILLVLSFGFVANQYCVAIPRYLQMYRNNPFSKPELRNSCLVCHENPNGGGPRNEFGQAFVKNGRVLSDALVAAYPNMFMSDRALVGEVEIVFSDASDKVLLRRGKEVYQVDVPARTVKKLEHPELAAMRLPPEIPEAVKEESQAKMPEPVYTFPFDYHLINLPTPKPTRKGGVNLRITHRFQSPVFARNRVSEFDLFGLDGPADIGLGASVGVTNRLTLGFFRSSLRNTITRCGNNQFQPVPCSEATRDIVKPGTAGRVIEFTSDFSVFQEGEKFPFSFKARATIEGADDFKEFYTPNLQFAFSRSITRWGEIYFVPTLSFNTNPRPKQWIRRICESTNVCQSNNTVALGIGGTVRPIPWWTKRLALVTEVVPRVAGFTPLVAERQERQRTGIPTQQLGVPRWPQPSISFGLQFKTYRHLFEFVITNSSGVTTSRYVLGGGEFVTRTDDGITRDVIANSFRLGFNIYRQMR